MKALLAIALRRWLRRTLRRQIKAQRQARKERRSGVLIDEVEVTEVVSMAKYNKAIGMLIGGLIGILVTKYPALDSVLGNQVIIDQVIILITGLLGTYFAPKNAPE